MSQSQKAGAGAQQTQIMGDLIIHQGVTEQRAAEIADERARLVLRDYSMESAPEAFARIKQLDRRVVELLSAEGKLDALKDPAYQIALQKAQVGAASTDREGDYDLLARLLGQRAEQDSRYVRASVDRAVQVVDMIDDSALQGLNLLWIILTLTPGGETVSAGTKLLETLLTRFPYDNLPNGRRWLDHLDMIDLARITSGSITTLKKFVDIFADRWPGFLSTGFQEDVAADILKSCLERKVPALRIVEHDLKPGYYRLPYHSTVQLRNVLAASVVMGDDADYVIELAREKGNLDTKDESLVPKLEEAIAASQALSKIRTWWDQIPDYPTITAAGVAVAYANSLRYHDFSDIRGLAEYLELST
ncbi:LPO_1073/Vpar_1526 family protein [Pseudarthrobacter sp. alpha12b]